MGPYHRRAITGLRCYDLRTAILEINPDIQSLTGTYFQFDCCLSKRYPRIGARLDLICPRPLVRVPAPPATGAARMAARAALRVGPGLADHTASKEVDPERN
jgi:hypothetical protein